MSAVVGAGFCIRSSALEPFWSRGAVGEVPLSARQERYVAGGAAQCQRRVVDET